MILKNFRDTLQQLKNFVKACYKFFIIVLIDFDVVRKNFGPHFLLPHFLLRSPEAVAQTRSVKKVFLEISQNS